MAECKGSDTLRVQGPVGEENSPSGVQALLVSMRPDPEWEAVGTVAIQDSSRHSLPQRLGASPA